MRFDDHFRFFRSWIDRPRNVGAIFPTSTIAARSMASVANPASGLPVLELGPGTGVITRAIIERGVAPSSIVSVEYCPEFHARLALDHPDVNFVLGDAFDLDTALGAMGRQKFDCAVSGIPLLNFPVPARIALIEDLLGRLPPGRPVVQFSYGPVSPVPGGSGSFEITHHDFVMRNVPPARLWRYSRPG